MAFPSYVDAAAVAATGGSADLTIPATVAVGDVMLIGAFSQAGTEPAAPTGWGLVGSVDSDVGIGGGSAGMAVYIRTATLDDLGGAVTVTLVWGTADFELALLVAYRGADPSDFDTFATDSSGGSVGNNILSPVYTTTVADDTIVNFYGSWSDTAVINPVTAPGNEGSVTLGITAGMAVGDQAEPTPTTNAAPNATCAADGPYACITVALKPAIPASPTITSSASVSFSSGSSDSHHVIATGTPTPTLTETGTLPSGITFVDNGDGSGLLSGASTEVGVYPITFTAANTAGTVDQSFTLTITSTGGGGGGGGGGGARPNRWTLFDALTNETYTFDINPKAGSGLPAWAKTFGYQSTAAVGGGLVLWETQAPPTAFQFTGTILAEAQYDALAYWFTKTGEIVLTDDLGQISTIYITGFTPRRIRTKDFPWHHDYTVDAFYLRTGA